VHARIGIRIGPVARALETENGGHLLEQVNLPAQPQDGGMMIIHREPSERSDGGLIIQQAELQFVFGDDPLVGVDDEISFLVGVSDQRHGYHRRQPRPDVSSEPAPGDV
jgi:hypothetical protein